MKKSPYHQDSMFKGASPETFQKAKELRQNLTKAERVIWEFLRKKETLGYRFRRQHPLGIYILDFYNHKLKLCIEIDGSYHNQREQQGKDAEREEYLKYNGINTVRFTNNQVLNHTQDVIDNLRRIINETQV